MLCGAGQWAPAALPRVSNGVHDSALYSRLSGLQRGRHSLRLRNGNRTDEDFYNDKIPVVITGILLFIMHSILSHLFQHLYFLPIFPFFYIFEMDSASVIILRTSISRQIPLNFSVARVLFYIIYYLHTVKIGK